MDFDNVGLLCGDPSQEVQRILSCLDVTPEVIQEAIDRDAQLIVAHHPVIFPKITRIVENDPTGSMLRKLIRHNIGVYASHTNLDASSNGVSQQLARQLCLSDIQILDYSYNTTKLVVVRLPAALKQDINEVLQHFGLGCHWASEEQNVAAGRFICDQYLLPEVEQVINQASGGAPVSIDRIPIETPSPRYGFGAIGSLNEPLSPNAFLEHVHNKLQADGLRYAGGGDTTQIKRVAVCGGSGSFLIKAAIKAGADAFVTADIKYHDYFVPSSLLLIDSGHYETEAPAIRLIAKALQDRFSGLEVFTTGVNTNPMQAYISSNS
jgi:dinuclear metal center YbgI/SA1388 family protein